jgi:phosphoribosyl 1,2-cyclic phosphodiesterase
MSFEYCVLGSGSSGNSTVFWDSETAFLIDAGFSCLELGRRLDEIGIWPGEINAIFISHEHGDHARGARVFSKRFGPAVLCTPRIQGDFKERYGMIPEPDIEPGQTHKLNGFSITPFEVPHDAVQTVGFVIKQGRKKVTVATDIGHMPSIIKAKFRNSNAIILESNHDVQMLKDGPYPIYLKKRILSKRGHLSNVESAATLASVVSEKTRHITLAHLSRENNRPEIALKEAKKLLSSVGKRRMKVVPADQFEVGDIVKVR